MSVANKKSYQTSRMYYKQKDHKAIYMDGKFHHNIIITDENGNYDFEEDNRDKLAWHKSFDDEYIIFPYKILVYPKEKILTSPMKRVQGLFEQHFNSGVGIKCGNYYYDTYSTSGGGHTYITKSTKDGRILYERLTDIGSSSRLTISNTLNAYDKHYPSDRLGNNVSCSNGFLYYTHYINTSVSPQQYYDQIYFQNIDANGNLSTSILICDTGELFNTNERIIDVFTSNNYIWIYTYSTDGFTKTGWNLHKVSTSGSIISTYSKIKPENSVYNDPILHIVNNTIYFTTQHWHSYRDEQQHTVYDIQRFLVLDETFNTIFYVDGLPHHTFTERITVGMAYIKNKYYLYFYWINYASSGGMFLRVYSGSSVSSLSLTRTLSTDTTYTFPNLSYGDNSVQFNLVPTSDYIRRYISKYHNTYRNRQLVTSDNYVVMNSSYVFDNGELDFNENCFYAQISNINGGPNPSQEQIFDKYLGTQQGGE